MDRCVAYGASLSKNFSSWRVARSIESRGKKKGESEETVRVREEDFFLLSPYTHPLFFLLIFFLARLLYLNAGTGYPPAGAGRRACGRKKAEGNQNLMSTVEITVLPYPNLY